MIEIHATTNGIGTELFRVSIQVDAEDMTLIPKSVRLRATQAWFVAEISLYARGENDRNEAGLKRLKTLLTAADKHGIPVGFVQPGNVARTAFPFIAVTSSVAS